MKKVYADLPAIGINRRYCVLPLVDERLHRVVILMILAVMPTISSKTRFYEFRVL